MDKVKIIYKEECFAIQGCVFEVYRVMGCGFLEPVYQECLASELRRRSIPFFPQRECLLSYKGEALEQKYKPDFICYDKIILEIKAAREIAPEHKAQVFNYHKATRFKLGLLVNFGHHPKAQVIRIVL
jgi:GxxExxY protein